MSSVRVLTALRRHAEPVEAVRLQADVAMPREPFYAALVRLESRGLAVVVVTHRKAGMPHVAWRAVS
jgi:hypothetical protein